MVSPLQTIIFSPLSEQRLLERSARSSQKPFRNVRATTASFSTWKYKAKLQLLNSFTMIFPEYAIVNDQM